MTLINTTFPGSWRKSQKDYSYYLPGDLFSNKGMVLDMKIVKQIENTSLILGKFSDLIEPLPNPLLFIHAYTKKEATLSSRIEGTQTNIEDAFMPEDAILAEKHNDMQEVRAYIKAMETAVAQLEQLPLCNRLIRNAHKVLLSNVRGKDKLPGSFRTSQNWIGGSQPSNARFVPPSNEYLAELMGNLEKFMQDDTTLPNLVKIALIHYQFETIHPFLDGNGRIGRMLVPLYLLEKKILKHPVLYISQFFESNRAQYYDALDYARNSQDGIIKWISFFLDALYATANDGITVTKKIISYDKELREKVLPTTLGRRTNNGLKLLDLLFEYVIIDAKIIIKHLDLSPQITQNLLKQFIQANILVEVTGNKRNRRFVFKKYLDLLSS